MRIILIDDDTDILEALSWALEKRGREIQCYTCPLKALEEMQSQGPYPSLIIVDYRMQSMDGLEFLKIKESSAVAEIKYCPTILLSAAAPKLLGPHLNHNALVVAKPIDLDSFTKIIEKILNQETMRKKNDGNHKKNTPCYHR